MSKRSVVALIEPCFYGMGFVDAALESGRDFVAVVSDKDNPKLYGYDGKCTDVIVADIRDWKCIADSIECSAYRFRLDAVIPANDYVVHIAARVSEKLKLKHIPYESVIKARLKDETRIELDRCGAPMESSKIASKSNRVISFGRLKATMIVMGTSYRSERLPSRRKRWPMRLSIPLNLKWSNGCDL